MATQTARFQHLQPMSIDQRIKVAMTALGFFNPLAYRTICRSLGRAETDSIFPFSGMDFLQFLALPNSLPAGTIDDPNRYLQRIKELLRSLATAGLLQEQGAGRSAMTGGSYFSMFEATNIERQGNLYLARALGPQFLPFAYRPGTYQITGIANGNVHAGTAIAITPRWLLTCAHVLQDMEVDDEQTATAHGYPYRIVQKVPHDRVDVGLIKVDRDLPVVPGLNFRDPYVGERVYTFGFSPVPLSTEPILVMQGGEVSVERMESCLRQELFLFSAIARPGNSGGPILSADGHVVGIVAQELTERDSQAQPFHAGIATATLAQAIDDLNCGVPLPTETWQ